MRRSFELEILERGDLPETQVDSAYRDLTRIHRWLGDTAFIASAVRRDPLPVRRILDIGCGRGGVLRDLRRRLAVDVVGVDVQPQAADASVPIVKADAVHDALPRADIAISLCVGHHLRERDLVRLIRNVGRFCRRFILLDLVRHPLPMALFRTFLAPFVSPVSLADGSTSIRRSYTPAELAGLAEEAIGGTGAFFRHSVAPLYIRQILDVSYSEQVAP
jgi:SAM-dependent methyltransferase